MIKKLTFATVLVLTAIIGFAQQKKIAFEKYGVAEGLPEEFVRTSLQDDKGFIWFGTQNGLVKYDGYRFKVFKLASDRTDTSNIQLGNLYGGLLKARDGKIWIADDRSGITSFNPVTEKFSNLYPAKRTSNAADENLFYLLFEDEAGNIWFKNSRGFSDKFYACRLNPTTGVIMRYPVVDINKGNRYFKGFGTLESSGTVWLLDDKKNLQRLNQQKDSFEIIIPAGKDILQTGKADTLRQIGIASANRILLTGRHGLYIFDSKNQKIAKSYVHQPGNANGIADSVIYAFEDLKGQIWLAHQKGILSLIDPVSDKIQTFTYGRDPLPYQKGSKAIGLFIATIQNNEGILFQGLMYGGGHIFMYYKFDKKTFDLYDYNFNLPDNPLPQNAFPYWSLQDHTGLLWLSTRPGLYKQAPKKQQMDLFRFRADETDGLPSDTIRCLFEDSKKRLWIGTLNGLALYQDSKDNFKVFKNNPSNPTSITNNSITTVQEDANGKIWIGTQNGLNQYQESTRVSNDTFIIQKKSTIVFSFFPTKKSGSGCL